MKVIISLLQLPNTLAIKYPKYWIDTEYTVEESDICLLQSASTLAIKYPPTDNRDNSKAWNAARRDEILWSACLQLGYDLQHVCAFICPEDFTC